MTPEAFSELGLVEKPTLALLESLGYETIDAYTEAYGPRYPPRATRAGTTARK